MIYTGTSGYSYKDWVGPVYPAATAPKDFLPVYGKEFSFTELNFSYYRQPDFRTIERLVHGTGDGFQFSIKAHQSMTHEIRDDCGEAVALFKKGITPLVESAKLGAILLQFPYSFHYNVQARKHLLHLCSAFEHLPVAVEFRNNEWFRDSVYRGLKDHNVALVSVDEPDMPGLPRPIDFAVASLGYVRFHGRNKEQWWQGDNASRYDYRYSEAELSEWVPRIEKIARECVKTMIAFNNHWKGQAFTNARQIRQLLRKQGVTVV